MMNINFSGYNENVVAFQVKGNDVFMGTPVKMESTNTVTACEDGDNMIGVAVNVRNGYAVVQLTGYIEMPTDNNFEVGYQKISASDDGKVKASNTGREYLVVHTDSGVVGFIL